MIGLSGYSSFRGLRGLGFVDPTPDQFTTSEGVKYLAPALRAKIMPALNSGVMLAAASNTADFQEVGINLPQAAAQSDQWKPTGPFGLQPAAYLDEMVKQGWFVLITAESVNNPAGGIHLAIVQNPRNPKVRPDMMVLMAPTGSMHAGFFSGPVGIATIVLAGAGVLWLAFGQKRRPSYSFAPNRRKRRRHRKH